MLVTPSGQRGLEADVNDSYIDTLPKKQVEDSLTHMRAVLKTRSNQDFFNISYWVNFNYVIKSVEVKNKHLMNIIHKNRIEQNTIHKQRLLKYFK